MKSDRISTISPLSASPTKKFVLALVACALFLATAFCLAGCKPPAGQLAANAAIAEMGALDKKDPEAIGYIPEVVEAQSLEQIGVSEQEFFDWWLEGFSYSLGDVELNVDEDAGEVNAKITCRQLEPIIRQWSNEYVTWLVSNSIAIQAGQTEDPCEYGRLLLQSMFESNEPTLVECMIQVQKYDDAWSVVASQDNGLYRDALLGSTENLSGYYIAPFEALAALGVELPVSQGEASAADAADETVEE